MDWQMLGAIAESLGAAGVIVSLLYLAAQVRSGASATRRSNAHEFKTAWRAFFALVGGNKEVGSIWLRGMANPESLSTTEYFQFSTLLLQATTLWEEAYFAAQDKEVHSWATYSDAISRPEIVSLPGFARWYEERGHWFTPEFRKVIESDMAKGVERVTSFYSEVAAGKNET